MVLPVSFTQFKSHTPLSKSYNLDSKNSITKLTTAQMTSGNTTTIECNFSAFGSILDGFTAKDACGYGLATSPKNKIVVDSKANPPESISRSKRFFQYREKPGVLMLDHDPSDFVTRLTPESLLEFLNPILGNHGYLVRGSVSSGVHLIGQPVSNSKGYHVYIPVLNATDIPRAGKVLFKRLWLAGHGVIALAKNGAMLVRTIIDGSVFSPERLDFTGQPVILSDSLQFTPPTTIYNDGGYLDTSIVLDLNEEEEARYNQLVANAKDGARPQSQATEQVFITEKVAELVACGVSEWNAKRRAFEFVSGGSKDLYPEDVLHFASLGMVTVKDVLANPKLYNKQALADPVEGTSYGKTTAILYSNAQSKDPDSKPVIHSLAHGGSVNYFLHSAVEKPVAASDGYDDFDDVAYKKHLESEVAVEAEESSKKAWFEKLIWSKQGDGIKNIMANVRLAIENVGITYENPITFSSVIGYNEFKQRIDRRGWLPWRSCESLGQWEDKDTLNLTNKLNVYPGIHCGSALVHESVALVAFNNPFNLAQDKLRALGEQWDGTPRLENWLVDYLGASNAKESSAYMSELSYRWLIGVVARVMQPGCKRDDVLVLDGKQGIGKSTVSRLISDTIIPGAFTDTLPPLNSKDSLGALRGLVIVELGELSTLGKSEIETIKAYVSAQSDHFREAYGRTEKEWSRTVSFIGTTNGTDYLKDHTGNRRFWPVSIPSPIDLVRFGRDLPQLLGEAFVAYSKGEQWHVTNVVAIQQAEVIRADHFQADVWTINVLNATDALQGDGHCYLCNGTDNKCVACKGKSSLPGAHPEYVTIDCILNAMGIPLTQCNRASENRVGTVLQTNGFNNDHRAIVNGKRKRVWKRNSVPSVKPAVVAVVAESPNERCDKCENFRKNHLSPLNVGNCAAHGNAITDGDKFCADYHPIIPF